jgi:hypothetical protein
MPKSGGNKVWTDIGNKIRLDAVTNDPTAAWQGNVMDFDPATLILDYTLCNSTHLRFQPVLPAAITSGPHDTLVGKEWLLSNGWVFGIADTQGFKLPGILTDYVAPGLQFYFIVPVGDVPASGTFKIEELQVLDGVFGNYTWPDQGVLSAEDIAGGSSRPDHGNHNLMVYSQHRNVNSADPNGRWMTGKALELKAPLSYGLNISNLQTGTFTGRTQIPGSEVVGSWDVLASGIKKGYNCTELHDSKGAATHFLMAATLGYTSVGQTQQNSVANYAYVFGPIAATGGSVSEIVWLTNSNNANYECRTGMYEETTPNALVTGSDSGRKSYDSIDSPEAGKWWRHIDYTGSEFTVPTNDIHLCVMVEINETDFFYDAGTGKMANQLNSSVDNPLPNPWGSYSVFRSNVDASVYATLAGPSPSPGGGTRGPFLGGGVGRVGMLG